MKNRKISNENHLYSGLIILLIIVLLYVVYYYQNNNENFYQQINKKNEYHPSLKNSGLDKIFKYKTVLAGYKPIDEIMYFDKLYKKNKNYIKTMLTNYYNCLKSKPNKCKSTVNPNDKINILLYSQFDKFYEKYKKKKMTNTDITDLINLQDKYINDILNQKTNNQKQFIQLYSPIEGLIFGSIYQIYKKKNPIEAFDDSPSCGEHPQCGNAGIGGTLSGSCSDSPPIDEGSCTSDFNGSALGLYVCRWECGNNGYYWCPGTCYLTESDSNTCNAIAKWFQSW